MSFPRAKLQRFNETQTCTPSPADYNVGSRSHVAGAVIPKSERFSEQPSPAASDNASFASSNGKPTFRTPNLPRRIKRQISGDSKIKGVDLFQSGDDIDALKEKIVECNNKDLYIQDLTEQLEEMKHKLAEVQKELCRLLNNKQLLEEDLKKINENHEKAMNELQTHHQHQQGQLRERILELNQNMKQLQTDHTTLTQANKENLAEVLRSITKLEELQQFLIDSYKTLLEQKTKEVDNKEQKIMQLEEECKQLQEKYKQDMDCAQNRHQEEVQNVEYEMLKTISDMQNQLEKEKQRHEQSLKESLAQQECQINNLSMQHEEERKMLEKDSEAKIKQLTENFKETSMLAEMQMKEKCNDIEMCWKLKLEEAKQESNAILKECQAIAEYSVIQCEVEKNEACFKLSEQCKHVEELKLEKDKLHADYELLHERYKLLQGDLHNVVVDLMETREKLTNDVQSYQRSVDQLTKEKHTYEVTIQKTHETVETLKKRLMRSDQDVEQLKAQLDVTEGSKLELEDRCNQLEDELQSAASVRDELMDQYEMNLIVAEDKVLHMEASLLEKVETYKRDANMAVCVLTQQLERTKEELFDVSNHLHEQNRINIDAHQLITKSKEKIENLEQLEQQHLEEINILKDRCATTQMELASALSKEAVFRNEKKRLDKEYEKSHAQIDTFQSTQGNLLNLIEVLKAKCIRYEEREKRAMDEIKVAEEDTVTQTQYDELLQRYRKLLEVLDEQEEENRRFKKKIADQESLIGPFRDHLEAYEMEYKALMNQKQDAEKEAKEMGLKYAEILGHQNQKQKIKHLIDLKKKNYELSENKKELESKLRTQLRTIEKLKKELSLVTTRSPLKLAKTEDKENINSPNRTLNSSRLDSPGGPLRDRN